MDFKKLIAMLIIQRSNFQILHWKVRGEDFDNMHANVTNGYYEMVSSDIDDVVEVAMRLDINPVNHIEACKIVLNDGNSNIMYPSDKDYSRDEVIVLINKSLINILSCIKDVLETDEIQNEISNVGIKSYLEALYDKYDKECRFLNRRRSL